MWLLAEPTGTATGDDTAGYVEEQTMAHLRVGLDVRLGGLEAASSTLFR